MRETTLGISSLTRQSHRNYKGLLSIEKYKYSKNGASGFNLATHEVWATPLYGV